MLVMVIGITGCTEESDDVKKLTVAGSTTVQPVAAAAAEQYMNEHDKVDIQVSGGGSSVGVQQAGEGTVDIGMASRDIKSSELTIYPGLVAHTIAYDGIAIIVHPDNPITELTLEQVTAIFAGNITNWQEVGGDDANIGVIGRDANSGTRDVFEEFFLDPHGLVPAYDAELASSGGVHGAVADAPGAIGYVGLAYLNEEVKGLDLKEDENATAVTPSVANVKSGEYAVARNLNLITMGQPTGLAKDLIDWIMGPDGQAIVEGEGFVPL